MVMSGISPVPPVSSVKTVVPAANRTQREGLQRAEREVMRQEMAIRNHSDITSTVYRYAVGPDGKRYITGATVTYKEKEDELSGKAPDKNTSKSSSGGSNPSAGKTDVRISDEDHAKLKAIERDVIAHEAAHKAVGGQYAGPVSYTYATAPDGTRYIVGGEVSISAPEGRTPEETIRIMEQVKRAALAPGSPSPQDIQVAAAASAAQMRARAELAKQEAEKAYSGESGREDAARWGEFAMSA
jgi:hypothetical protein